VGLNGGNYAPADADATWERRYGDCKGKTAILLALLAELGIKAMPVLVNNTIATDGYEDRLPNPGLFDHVLVRARIDGKSFWLDGTLPTVIEAREQPFFNYMNVLPLSEAGSDLERLEVKPLDLPHDMALNEYDASAGFDVPAEKTRTTIKRGILGLQEYAMLSAMTTGQMEAAFRSNMAGTTQWDTVDTIEYRYDKATQASILTINGTGMVDWEGEAGGARWLYLPGGGFNPPGRRRRSDEFDSDIPFYNDLDYSCHVTTIRLPEDTKIENWGFNDIIDLMLFGTVYFRMMERREDKTFRLVRGMRTEMLEVSQERAQRDNGRLAEFDNSKAILVYDADEISEPWGQLLPVPATYEIDWTGKDVPCLPEDLLDQ
jgi:hypothetical protein